MRTFVLVVATTMLATGLHAQSRAELFGEADFADPDSAQQLLSIALNPDSGYGDDTWRFGLQFLAGILIEAGQETNADAWLRWGLRLDPAMTLVPGQSDALNVAFRSAEAFVGSDTIMDVTQTSWEWREPDATATNGEMRIGAMVPDVAVVAVQESPLRSGQRTPLRVGSYDMSASSTGFVTARRTREVLPGVTTVVEFTLAAVVAPADPAVEPPPPDPAVVPADTTTVDVAAVDEAETEPESAQLDAGGGGGGIGIILGLLGAAGGAAAYLILGGGGPPDDPCAAVPRPAGCDPVTPTTGGLTVIYIPIP